jgi:hypothetical protein
MMVIRPRTLATGLVSFVPGARWAHRKLGSRPGPVSALRCYGLWMKHLCMARMHGMRSFPRTVAEFGPGESIGTGIAALISGVERYCALDAVPYADKARSLRLFDELVELFRSRRRPANSDDFPRYATPFEAHGFPAAALTEAHLREALDEDRIATLRAVVAQFARTGVAPGVIEYHAPWSLAEVGRLPRADLVMAHAVWQHVRLLREFFIAVRQLALPGAYITSQSSYDSHNITHEWNGHWACSHTLWKVALGRKDFLINRMPHSAVVSMLRGYGLEIAGDVRMSESSAIARASLRDEWQWLTDEDMQTRYAFIVARNPVAEAPEAPSPAPEAAFQPV